MPYTPQRSEQEPYTWKYQKAKKNLQDWPYSNRNNFSISIM